MNRLQRRSWRDIGPEFREKIASIKKNAHLKIFEAYIKKFEVLRDAKNPTPSKEEREEYTGMIEMLKDTKSSYIGSATKVLRIFKHKID